MCEYAKLADLEATNCTAIAALDLINDTRNELGWIADGYKAVLGSPDTCLHGDVGGAIGSKIANMEFEMTQIKEALLDIQMTLSSLGLDDMSRRLGDLNLLMT